MLQKTTNSQLVRGSVIVGVATKCRAGHVHRVNDDCESKDSCVSGALRTDPSFRTSEGSVRGGEQPQVFIPTPGHVDIASCLVVLFDLLCIEGRKRMTIPASVSLLQDLISHKKVK